MHLYDLQTSEDERLYLYCLLEKIMIIVKKKNTGCAIGVIVQKIHVLLKYRGQLCS